MDDIDRSTRPDDALHALRPSSPFKDGWFAACLVITTAAYLALPFLRPSGEGWGRGWNLVAYWFYSSPAVALAGVLVIWRLARRRATTLGWTLLLPMASFIYPVVALLVIRGK